LSRKAVLEQIHASLGRLGTDYVDLYQIHRFDPDTPVEETMEALHDIVKAGKVRYIGASSMYAWQFAKLQHAADLGRWTRFVSMQNQYNLICRTDEPELMAMCADMGVGLVPYSPQGKGRLARPWGEQSLRSTVDNVVKWFTSPLDEPVVNAVQRIAEARQVRMAQVALAWVLTNPIVSAPIVGATKPHHLTEPLRRSTSNSPTTRSGPWKSHTHLTGGHGSSVASRLDVGSPTDVVASRSDLYSSQTVTCRV
jgi:aryl-alcohol dehydrogenase-like predicted oxidoreductase